MASGETGTLAVIAADRRQARVVMGYVKAFLDAPLLRPLVKAALGASGFLVWGLLLYLC